MNDEYGRMSKEVVTGYFNVLTQHSLAGTASNHKKKESPVMVVHVLAKIETGHP
jgi:hypothetical protein